MLKAIQHLHPLVFLIIATTLEVTGDAIIRKSIYNYTGIARLGMMILGAVMLFGYGFCLNLAPVEFGKVVGLYIATLFIVWQVTTYFTFGSIPDLPVIIGGILIIAGGMIITFWKSK